MKYIEFFQVMENDATASRALVMAVTLIFAIKLLNPWPPIFMKMKRLYYIMWDTEVRGKLC
jgi:hypothetical protein